MIMTIFFVITCYPVLFILYFAMKSATEAKNGYCVGAFMKSEWMQDAEVQKICTDFRKDLNRLTAIMAVVPLGTFFLPGMSIGFSIWMLWLMAVIFLPAVPYVRANRKIREVKAKRGWQKSGQGMVYTEMKAADGIRKVKLLPFMPPILISAAAAVWSVWYFGHLGYGVVWGVIVTFALLTLLFYLLALWVDRKKVRVISYDSEINLGYGRGEKNIWKNFSLTCAWINTIFTVAMTVTLCLEGRGFGILLWGSCVYGVITVLVVIFFWKKLQKLEEAYASKRNLDECGDGDEYWIGGICYYNKKDTHSMVTARAGFGTTTNLATPWGMGCVVLASLTFLAIPVCCLWLILEEYTPIELSLENEMLVAEHLSTDYEIPVAGMKNVTIIHDLPSWSKVKGTGMENLCKGTFHIRNEGKCEVFVNPQNTLFLQFGDTAGKTYYMSAANDAATEALIEELEKQIETTEKQSKSL